MASIAGGALVLLLFFWQQNRIDSPVLDLALFRNNRCFSFSNTAIMIYTTATLAVVFLFSFYLQYVRGFEAQTARLVLLASSLIMAVLLIFAGRLSDRVNLYHPASAGAIISLAGLISMANIVPSTPLFLGLIELVLVSVGGSFFYPPMVKIILSSISRDKYGVGSSLAETMRLIGNASSMSLVTVGFALYLGAVDITPGNSLQFMYSMRVILAVFSGLCLATLLLVFLAERNRPAKRGLKKR
jgi:MFS family permease